MGQDGLLACLLSIQREGVKGGGRAYLLLTFHWPDFIIWSHLAAREAEKQSLCSVGSQIPSYNSILEEVLGQVTVSTTGTIK